MNEHNGFTLISNSIANWEAIYLDSPFRTAPQIRANRAIAFPLSLSRLVLPILVLRVGKDLNHVAMFEDEWMVNGPVFLDGFFMGRSEPRDPKERRDADPCQHLMGASP